MTVFGYIRESTDGQRESGLGREAQRQSILRDRRVDRFFEDTASGSNTNRPGLQECLQSLSRGDTLVVAKLDRLSRSLMDFTALLERSRSDGWFLVALDMQVDTSTPAGEMMIGVLALFAQYERRLISLRTKEALRARGEIPEETRARIISLVPEHGLRGTAKILNEEGVPRGRGGREWYGSSVRSVVRAG